MSSIVRHPNQAERHKHGVGAGTQRLSASTPRPAPTPRPGPFFVFPTSPFQIGDPRFWGMFLEEAKSAELIQKAKKAKVPNLASLGFMIGWELGQMAIDAGWLPLPGGAPEYNPDLGYDLSGTNWVVGNACSTAAQGCTWGGPSVWHDTDGSHVDPNCVPFGGPCADKTSGLPLSLYHSDPWVAYNHSPGTVTEVRPLSGHADQTVGWAARNYSFGPNPNPDPGVASNWVPLGDPVPTGIVPLRDGFFNEQPDAWPMHQPMQMPNPQRFEDAAPQREFDQPALPRPLPAVSVAPLPNPLMPPVVVISPSPNPATPPVVIPVQVVEVSPVAPPIVTREPPPTGHPRTPPPNVKEKKLNVASVGGKVWVAVNLATEAADFVGALHSALPDECKKLGGPGESVGGMYNQLQDIWNCWDHLDDNWLQDAFVAFVNNQVEDMVYGTIGMAGTKATQNLGINTGLQSALREGQDAVEYGMDAANQEAGNEAEDLEYPIPVLAQLPDGSWELQFGDLFEIQVAPR